MRKLLYALAVVAIFALASCNTNYKTTPSGMKYKIFPGKVAGAENIGKPVKVGGFVKYSFRYSIPEQQDTVLRDFYGKMPNYFKVDTGMRVRMMPQEIFPEMKSGDSAELLVSIDSILKQMPAGSAPPFFKKGNHIKVVLSILNVFDNDSLVKADYNKEQDKEVAKEKVQLDAASADLDKYITSNGIKATKTKNGVYVVLDNPGDISLKADSGMQVSVNYTGTVIGGKTFDSNTDSSFHHTQPINVLVDSHQTIQGWDEALPYFAKGAKGKIYIPAKLAYGSQQAGPNIPPYSNLEFDIEVLDVKKPQAQPSAPAAPNAALQQQLQKQLQEKMKGTAPAHK